MSRPTMSFLFSFFFFNDTATTEIYTLSLHDALPICGPAFDKECHSWIPIVGIVGQRAPGKLMLPQTPEIPAEKCRCPRRRELSRLARDLADVHPLGLADFSCYS